MENLQIIKNTQLNGVELYFSTKPIQNIIESLKLNGFRWHNVKKCWYAKENNETLDFIKSLDGSSELNQNLNQIQTQEINNKPLQPKRTRQEILSFYGYTANNEGYMGGSLLIGKNHNTKMEQREISNKIKKDFKELYPTLDISISYKSYSMGSSRTAWIIADSKILYIDINKINIDEDIHYDFKLNDILYCNRHYNDGWGKISNIKDENLKNELINIFYNNFIILEEHQAARSKDKFYNDEIKKAIDDLNIMLKSFAYVESNSYVDYFSGYDTPEVRVMSTLAKQKDIDLHTMTKTKNGWDEYYKKYPTTSDLIEKLEKKYFNNN